MNSRTVWHLQHFCKCIPERFGVCSISANVFPNGLTLAAFLQTHSRTVWCLQRFCKCIPERFDACSVSASKKPFGFGLAACLHVFGMVGAVPVCPPERPRSGVSIPKYIYASRIMHEDLTMDAPLRGALAGTQARPLPRLTTPSAAFLQNHSSFRNERTDEPFPLYYAWHSFL